MKEGFCFSARGRKENGKIKTSPCPSPFGEGTPLSLEAAAQGEEEEGQHGR